MKDIVWFLSMLFRIRTKMSRIRTTGLKNEKYCLVSLDAIPLCVCAEELYQAVENLCTYKMAETVYQRLKALIENHVAEVVKQFLGKRSQRHRFDFPVRNMYRNLHDTSTYWVY
jgi:hypothetical protein